MEPIRPPRVLLIDDDPSSRYVVADLLRGLGVAVDEASDGQDGVRRCVGMAYDVVLMDVQTPAGGRVEALQAIRTLLPAERQPRVVAMTDRAREGAPASVLAAGFDGFVAKPPTADGLAEAVGVARRAAPVAVVARPAPPAAATAATAAALYEQVAAHVTDMLGEEDPEFVADLVESFAVSSREAVADAQSTRSAGDADGLASAAHRLKGSASNVGLGSLATQWGEVEETVRGGAAPGDAVDRALRETVEAVELLEGRV